MNLIDNVLQRIRENLDRSGAWGLRWVAVNKDCTVLVYKDKPSTTGGNWVSPSEDHEKLLQLCQYDTCRKLIELSPDWKEACYELPPTILARDPSNARGYVEAIHSARLVENIGNIVVEINKTFLELYHRWEGDLWVRRGRDVVEVVTASGDVCDTLEFTDALREFLWSADVRGVKVRPYTYEEYKENYV